MRSEMVQTMIKCGLDIECHHHEVATGGQCEIDQKFDTLVKSADNMMTYKYVIRNVANQYGKTVTFMPKPLFQDNGSGMHTHQSIWKGGKPLFAGDLYAGLSQMALWYIGGLLKHARALSAIIAPTTNSYKRLVPGYEAPVNLAYSRRNRSAACRIPMYSASPKAKRVEFRPPDPAANPYLAFAAMLMAGLDGMANKIEPGEPLDKDIYDLSPEEMKNVPSMPASLDEALNCLEDDHGFPHEGRRLQRRADRDLHRLQAQERGRRDSLAPASLRIRAVLRYLNHDRQGVVSWAGSRVNPGFRPFLCGPAGPGAAIDLPQRRGPVSAGFPQPRFKSIQPELLYRDHPRFLQKRRERAQSAGEVTGREAIGAADERMNLCFGPTEAGFIEIARHLRNCLQLRAAQAESLAHPEIDSQDEIR